MGIAKNRTLILDNKTAQESASTTLGDCTSEDLSTALQCAIEVDMTFDASATAGATVKVFASGDGTNFDTVEYATQSVDVSAGNAIQVTFPINPAAKYIRVQVTNLDTTYDITAISVWSIVQE